MSQVPHIDEQTIAAAKDCPLAKRNLDHHRGLCAFLAQSEDDVRAKLTIAGARYTELNEIEGRDGFLSFERKNERDALRHELAAGQREVDRILAALCYANEFMNA